jgi:hypothetical protein
MVHRSGYIVSTSAGCLSSFIIALLAPESALFHTFGVVSVFPKERSSVQALLQQQSGQEHSSSVASDVHLQTTQLPRPTELLRNCPKAEQGRQV